MKLNMLRKLEDNQLSCNEIADIFENNGFNDIAKAIRETNIQPRNIDHNSWWIPIGINFNDADGDAEVGLTVQFY